MSEEQRPVADPARSTWGSRLTRRRTRPPGAAVVVSVVLHVAVIASMWFAGVRLRPELPEFVQYQVTLVSPPPTEAAAEPEPVETTTPVVVEEPEPEPTPDPPKPQPKPETPRTQAPVEKPVERKPEPKPARGPDPKPAAVGGENLDIDIQGAEFPYPEYLANIVLQLKRYFRPPASNVEAEVVFYIQRDGTVGGVRVVQKSGNFNYDLQAVDAVDRAGSNRAFGPLPGGWQGDRLWISFTFKSES